eukprot:COSAG01_NODE_3245_length_6352_cov_137.561502_2_plen_36_part_00
MYEYLRGNYFGSQTHNVGVGSELDIGYPNPQILDL